MSIKAVVFDLDDTLYPEIDYVKSGFCEVGKEIERHFGIKNAYGKLYDYFLIDKNDVYGRVLRDCNVSFNQGDISDLIEIYRTHKPQLTLSDEVKDTLSALRANGLKLGIITDGRPHQQWAKIKALGVDKLVDHIIVTDELGGIEYRKPNPKAFEMMCSRFCIKFEEMVYVGDNPQKDFLIGKYGVTTVKVGNGGIYADSDYADGIKEDKKINTISDLLKIARSNV